MTEVIDIQHWLDEEGLPVPSLRKQVLRIARLIEGGGPLRVWQSRETLVECRRRVQRRACVGLLWVTKVDDETLEAVCPNCLRDRVVIRGWESTEWATGPSDPIDLSVPVPGTDHATPN